jgi:hypothetical protein
VLSFPPGKGSRKNNSTDRSYRLFRKLVTSVLAWQIQQIAIQIDGAPEIVTFASDQYNELRPCSTYRRDAPRDAGFSSRTAARTSGATDERAGR